MATTKNPLGQASAADIAALTDEDRLEILLTILFNSELREHSLDPYGAGTVALAKRLNYPLPPKL